MIKTYFKPISNKALDIFRMLSIGTEYEGKILNLQPGVWLRDSVLIELEKFYSERFFQGDTINLSLFEENSLDTTFNPFKDQSMKTAY